MHTSEEARDKAVQLAMAKRHEFHKLQYNVREVRPVAGLPHPPLSKNYIAAYRNLLAALFGSCDRVATCVGQRKLA